MMAVQLSFMHSYETACSSSIQECAGRASPACLWFMHVYVVPTSVRCTFSVECLRYVRTFLALCFVGFVYDDVYIMFIVI